jgi:hypothetical protein
VENGIGSVPIRWGNLLGHVPGRRRELVTLTCGPRVAVGRREGKLGLGWPVAFWAEEERGRFFFLFSFACSLFISKPFQNNLKSV